ncbi:AcrB/AcrD/AcrF family protein [Sphingosinicella sp. BN140058]|uniref:AcrB/AcrD/AcrF family protein n=1 Tax=Sphingosinicella sp. BN140058 TaxID=1892855 RepID=UPI001010C2A2|nr:AcrB/AcrD/AcrF family protein [Sphingosinicella sp. BN140058]QAY77204.1 AcrB/AcrD/AcrF family protein [Sphingosinicella sp. BN140058]
MNALDRLEKHWRWWLLLVWLVTCGLLIFSRWGQIRGFGLSDTDDNIRMMQVRALLGGQDWYDLRQYRLNPPYGADIHWSRIVDLPIAGIKLALAPLLGGAAAERWAVTVAPLLPLGVAMAAVAVTVRRLIAPHAYGLAMALLLCAHSARGMWSPLRIDHHGWQLAALSVAVMGLADPKRARGGIILGLATAFSLAIGLEMLLYLGLLGAAAGLLWLRDRDEARRLATYGLSLAGGCGVGFLVFASYANRAPVCDALSPVWLSVMVLAGALCVALALASPQRWPLRLGLAALAGATLAAFYALAWPHCLQRLEGVSPELAAMWLDNVREARPLYTHGWQIGITVVAMPVAGLIGYGLMIWRNRRDPAKVVAWSSVAAPALLAALLLLWQSRAGPAAQLLSIPGATALGWLIVPSLGTSRWMLLRVVGTVAVFLLVSGILPQEATRFIPKPQSKVSAIANKANGSCPTLAALRPIAQQPKGYVLTFVDLGPRLITVTHHDAVAGPYHRNGADILDVMKSFRGTVDHAHGVIARRKITYVLICPGMAESTVYAAYAKNGFYMQLVRNKLPAWLERVPLPKDSPYRMYRVIG